MKNKKRYREDLCRMRRSIVISLIGVGVMIFFCVFAVQIWPRISGKPQITINGLSDMTIAAGADFMDEGAHADILGENVDDRIYVTGEVDTSVPGTYEISYNVDGRWQTYSAVRTVTVKDETAPEITLNGEENVTVDRIEDYQEPGASACDNCDGDLTDGLTEEMEQVNAYTYQVTYRAEDAAGNVGTAVRQVVIRDTVPPEISLSGEASVSIKEREKFEDPGATAQDDRDGDLTSQIERSGYIDIYRPGTYTVVYTVSDAGGNQAQVQRQVTVEQVYSNPANSVYLTFDDGPSADVTPQILDTLAKNNVKATFFICDYDDSKIPLLKRMIAEGHTIGIHGYSHDYKTIYASPDAFMDNVYKLRDKLKEDTGYEAFCMRFPGGSSNTVSAKYCPGIMTNLVQKLTDDGMMYVDWNVSSGDASGKRLTPAQIAANVRGGLKHGRGNIVLMHDTSAKKTTADAVQSMIDGAKADGYAFYPITADTVPVHQGIRN